MLAKYIYGEYIYVVNIYIYTYKYIRSFANRFVVHTYVTAYEQYPEGTHLPGFFTIPSPNSQSNSRSTVHNVTCIHV